MLNSFGIQLQVNGGQWQKVINMKKLIYILLIFVFGFKSEKKTPVKYRSFYIEMKRLEKPERVTAFAAVQTSSQTVTGSVTSATITLAATSVNNLVVVHIFLLTAAITVTSVTDNGSNTYEVGSALAHPAGVNVYQAYGVQTTSSTTVTINFSGTTSVRRGADEYSGFTGGGAINNANVFDVKSTGTGTGTALSVSTFTPAASGELVVASGFLTSGRTWTAGAGYTLYNGSNPIGMRSQYNLSATTSETAPFTISSSTDWGEIATAFKVPASSANTTNFFFNP